MPRAKNVNATAATAPAENDDASRRPLEWYATRLEDAEDLALAKTARYRKARDEFDNLIANHPDRARIAQVLDRMEPAYGKMVEATDAEAKAREQYEKRLAEDRAESATASVAPDAATAQENAPANGKAPEPVAVA